MRKTIITQNRITTYIMNWWGRIAGLALLALFFIVACTEDEEGLNGFRSGANKFKVTFAELEMESSVMTVDSLLTFSDPNQTLERRLLVGRYVDNRFGEISAEAFTQYGPLQPTVIIPQNAEVVSAFLVLSFDFYQYGGNEVSNNTFTVHELLDSIPPANPFELPLNIGRVPNYQPYYFNTSIPFDPTPIGSATFQVNPENFRKTLDDIRNNPSALNHKTIDSLEIQLNEDFATRLFEFARGQSEDYKNQRRFRRIFKGLAIRPSGSDTKVIGFNPQIDSTAFTKSRIIINYDEVNAGTGEKIRRILEYSLFRLTTNTVVFGFSKIDADRSGTPLSVLSTPNIESEVDANRYYQSGNPVTTKVSFDKFLEFTDTIPNLIFNSVEFSIEVDDAETFDPPSKLRLRYLTDINEPLNFFSDKPSEQQFPFYPASMTQDESGWFIIGQRLNANTVGNLFDINYDPIARRYSGDLTDFFQTLFNIKDERFRYTEFALTARIPLEGLSVNRTVFKKENIKLKIFYTVPILNNSPQ